ncbi:MAG: diguanylate cyclase [Magnetococcus sp. WYHC-3]
MRSILLIHAQELLFRLLERVLKSTMGVVDVAWVTSPEQALPLLVRPGSSFEMAVVDADHGRDPLCALLPILARRRIPVVVLVNTLEEAESLNEGIQGVAVEFVIKGRPQTLGNIASLVQRSAWNEGIAVLVAVTDDALRGTISQMLQSRRLLVFEAPTGEQALRLTGSVPDLRLAFVGAQFPDMSGEELVRRLRLVHTSEELPILGLTPVETPHMSFRFLTIGADDFVKVPFRPEELYRRLCRNVALSDFVHGFARNATLDDTTGLPNRRGLLERGEILATNARRGNLRLCLALLQVDGFLELEVARGRGAAERVLRRVAQVLDRSFRQSDVVGHFGGGEFCVLPVNMDPDVAPGFFEQLRLDVLRSQLHWEGQPLEISASIAVLGDLKENLPASLGVTETMLTEVRELGGNRVLMR